MLITCGSNSGQILALHLTKKQIAHGIRELSCLDGR